MGQSKLQPVPEEQAVRHLQNEPENFYEAQHEGYDNGV